MDIKINVSSNWKIYILFRHTKDILYFQRKKDYLPGKHQQILKDHHIDPCPQSINWKTTHTHTP